MLRVATGLERISSGDDGVLHLLQGKKLGLCAHPASVDSRLHHARHVFDSRGLELVALFGPEHGYGGEAQDMISVTDGYAQESLPVYSLYGPTEADLSPRPNQLDGLDAIVIDLQDVGTRIYTYIYTMAYCLKAAKRSGRKVIVCDRPNRIGGVAVEGPVLAGGYESFVGLYPIAMRHAMTIG